MVAQTRQRETRKIVVLMSFVIVNFYTFDNCLIVLTRVFSVVVTGVVMLLSLLLSAIRTRMLLCIMSFFVLVRPFPSYMLHWFVMFPRF